MHWQELYLGNFKSDSDFLHPQIPDILIVVSQPNIDTYE